MPDSMGFDFSELASLARDLGEVPKTAPKWIAKALKVTSGKVKEAAQESVKNGRGDWKALSHTIDYDLVGKSALEGSSMTAEVGYNRSRYGDDAKIGNLREFGAPNTKWGGPLAPHNDLLNALNANEDDLVDGLSKALKDAENEAGL